MDGQWVAFPTHEELDRATFDMVVAGRVLPDGDVVIMMVEAESTPNALALIAAGAPKPTEEVVASGLEASKPAIREVCRAQDELAVVAAKPAGGADRRGCGPHPAGARLGATRRVRPRTGQ